VIHIETSALDKWCWDWQLNFVQSIAILLTPLLPHLGPHSLLFSENRGLFPGVKAADTVSGE
jgi:hypothetical protein